MKRFASKKVEGGKLLKIEVDYDKKINNVKITGDFFLHPEDSINEIENSLKGLDVNEKEDNIIKKINEIVEKNNVEMIGISAEAIAETLKEAMK